MQLVGSQCTDLLQDLVEKLTQDVAQGLAIPSRFLFTDTQDRASLEQLRQHERMIKTFPEKSLRADRLRMLGVTI